ncbi:hypothetical protein B0H12DRAFT_1242455 [Mycena haematopus]|nr:hypothetical protein B0H12DRAFT_1242455 [Mycena haematopus]
MDAQIHCLSPADECILRSVSRFAGEYDEVLTYVDRHGTVYYKCRPLPPLHPLRPENQIACDAALGDALREAADALGTNPFAISDSLLWKPAQDDPPNRTRFGYTDTAPFLLPGHVVHERLASHDPEEDDDSAPPGARNTWQTSIGPATLRGGIADQPTRMAKDISCLTAELSIGGVKAYVLFDSGSSTDSLTPEFVRATRCRIFKLEEQVTLQLGCVGSRSRINFGARAPIDFGGLKGHAYFDLVNLDRYDGIISTPFMIKHGLSLDFKTREVRFPNGQTIPALSLRRKEEL